MLVVGDSFITLDYFRDAFADIAKTNEVRLLQLDESQRLVPVTESEKSLRSTSGATVNSSWRSVTPRSSLSTARRSRKRSSPPGGT